LIIDRGVVIGPPRCGQGWDGSTELAEVPAPTKAAGEGDMIGILELIHLRKMKKK
jgi:hypothetical protein